MRARRLSPFDPYTFLCALAIAIAHLAARRFEQAIEWADRALHDQPRLAPAMRVKVAALAHLGQLDEARAELSRMLAIDPKLTIAGFRGLPALSIWQRRRSPSSTGGSPMCSASSPSRSS